jgi:putative tricarboxylic transport membrane protein
MNRNAAIAILFAAAACLSASSAWPQGFAPSRPIEFVVHSAPGGGSDVFARAVVEMAEKEKLASQPLRVVNKTAGASAQAMAYLAEKSSSPRRRRRRGS